MLTGGAEPRGDTRIKHSYFEAQACADVPVTKVAPIGLRRYKPESGGGSAARAYRSHKAENGLGFAVDFGPPPADPNKQKTPIVEELRWLAFERVPNELEYHPKTNSPAA